MSLKNQGMTYLTIEEIRRRRLAQLIERSGGQARLAEKIGKSPAQISQWMNMSPDSKTGKPRAIQSETARQIEIIWAKPTGWMDNIQDVAESNALIAQEKIAPYAADSETKIPTNWPFLHVKIEDVKKLTRDQVLYLEGAINAIISEFNGDLIEKKRWGQKTGF